MDIYIFFFLNQVRGNSKKQRLDDSAWDVKIKIESAAVFLINKNEIESKSLKLSKTHLLVNINNFFSVRRQVDDCYKKNVWEKTYKSPLFVYIQHNTLKKQVCGM